MKNFTYKNYFHENLLCNNYNIKKFRIAILYVKWNYIKTFCEILTLDILIIKKIVMRKIY